MLAMVQMELSLNWMTNRHQIVKRDSPLDAQYSFIRQLMEQLTTPKRA
jgi:hypothetical protein